MTDLSAVRATTGSSSDQTVARVRAAPSVWRQTVLDELLLIEDELHRLDPRIPTQRAEELAAVRQHLESGLEAIDPAGDHGWRSLWRQWRQRVSGSQVEAAWGAAHNARLGLLSLCSEARLLAEIPALREDVDTYLGADTAQLVAAHKSLDRIAAAEHPTTDDRELLRALRRRTDIASDLEKQDVRAFGNLLARCSLWLCVAAVAAAAAHLLDSSLFSLCRTATAPGTDRCVTGSPGPHWFDVLAIEAIGAVGGLLSGILPLSRSRRKPGPWGVSRQQIALKATTGAVVAFLGVLFMQSELFPDLPARAGSDLLAYAALFGLSQQIITARADRFADELATNADGTAKRG